MLLDVISLAYRTVKSNKLRTGITVAIIALGIMALVGIITAIQAMNQKLTESFSTMGANGFSIRYKQRNFGFSNNRKLQVSKKGARQQRASNLGKPVTERQAETFLSNYHFPAIAGISVMASRNATVSIASKKTAPNVTAFGADEAYIDLNSFALAAGRNFSRQEVQTGSPVCILGWDVADKIFSHHPLTALGKTVRIEDIPYTVIGVFESRGSTFGFSRDNITVISYKAAKKYFSVGSYSVGVKVTDLAGVQTAMGEAEGLFRNIRGLTVTEESNFITDRSDSIAEKAITSLGFLTTAVTIIGIITLIGAAIGLMNIMLVSVTERTKEIGVIKAIGGKSSAVRQQFLTEAILISIAGALLGIFMGVLLGNGFALLLGTGFVMPWSWVAYGIIICSVVGLLAGLYPALKAGKLNPIDALRYE